MADGSGHSPVGSWPTIKTTCPYCGVGCGVEGLASEGRALSVAGDRQHPANQGRLCSKGLALGSTVSLEGRLLCPMIGEKEVGWGEATSYVARKLKETIARHGPDSVGFYVSGQLLTEDYYAANKLMKGFIGSGNIDTNSRLCMASAVAAHKLAFGADLVPGCYEDLELADLVVFSGHNAAFTHPILMRRMEAARKRGQRHVVIDPRRTDTAEAADLHLPLAPQTDVRLWSGLLAELIRRGAIDQAYIEGHVQGFEAVVAELSKRDQSISAVAADCGIAAADFERFCGWFAETPKTVSLFSMGANQSAQGTAKGLAILNVHLATGRIGKPGACPFSITGQPNAMGGRESGGMANTLAAHMDFAPEDVARVARFWGAPKVAAKPGLKAIEMFEAVRAGKIRALWIMATNPAVSLPGSSLIREALSRCPLVIVSDVMARTDTSRFAHVRLPALAWGEKDGTVTNSERRVSRQRPLFPAPGQAKGDWQIIAEVAQGMGFGDAFGWRSPHQVFREYARLTAYENQGRTARTLNLGPLVRLGPAEYEMLEPVQWPVQPNGEGTPRLFTDGRFPTPEGRARMHPTEPKGPAEATTAAFPLSLNTGRIRDQWHTMTRTGLAPELCRHAPEPYVEVNPEDALEVGVQEGQLTRIETPRGVAVALARVTDRQRRGGVFMPMHWTDAFAPAGRSNPLIGDARDPVSGQPEFKHSAARVRPYRETWKGFCVSKTPIAAPAGLELVWRRTPQVGGHLHEFAGRGDASERAALRRYLTQGLQGEKLVLEDPATGMVREAWLVNGELGRVLFFTTTGRLPPRGWLAGLLAEPLSDDARASLLHGRAPGAVIDHGPTVCACLGVGARTITAAIQDGCASVEAVGEATGAGTNCGSCRIEIGRMLSSAPSPSTPAPVKQETRDAA